MQYIPSTSNQENELLKQIGISDFAQLIKIIPENIRLKHDLNLESALSEFEVQEKLNSLASKNNSNQDSISFLGGGVYDHYIPTVIDFLSSRSEFYTAYTPYQAEVSQGTLQYLYEFQSMICELSGMDVANASLYDGASAVAEACSLAVSASRKKMVAISETLNPNYKRVVTSYLQCRNVQIIEIDSVNGETNCELINQYVSEMACVVIQSPNYYGLIENWSKTKEIIQDSKALLIAVSDPTTLPILESPRNCGADIYVGEGQTLGNPVSYGGPYLGLMAVTKKLMRKMPGRIIGKTNDKNGKSGFVLTLQTREQHIRRENATSNICTNQGLMALRATIYLSIMGKTGLPTLAQICYEKAHYLADGLLKLKGYSLPYGRNFLKEFVIKTPISAKKIKNEALKNGLLLNTPEHDLTDSLLLIAVTEKRTKNELDNLITELKKYS